VQHGPDTELDYEQFVSASGTAFKELFAKLLSLMAVPAEQQDEACFWLWIGLRACGDPIERHIPTVHNELLETIETAAKALLAGRQKLRESPYTFWDFWEPNSLFETALDPPAPCFEVEDEDTFRGIEGFVRRAEAAKDRRRHRPRDARKQGIVTVAACLFKQFSPLPLSGTPTGRFAEFARKFYWSATGVDADLDTQIRRSAQDQKGTQEVPPK
jgi:hypothetical protein